MARPRTPTAVLALRGSLKRNPKRYQSRASEPQVAETVGEPPATLGADAAAIWRELAAYGVWLTAADRLLLEIAATLMARFRSNQLDGGGISKLITALAKLGFSPTDRGKVNAPGGKQEAADPFAEFKPATQ